MGTYTYAIMEVSKETFEEIEKKMLAAGYGRSFHDNGTVIDMHGIALRQQEAPQPPQLTAGDLMIDPDPQRTEIERGAGDDYPVVDMKNKIFVDGGFDPNSYEERIKRSKGKRANKQRKG